MRQALKAVGLSVAAGALLLGMSATAAEAAPVQPQQSTASVQSTSVYVGTYSYPTCLSWVQYFNSIGYGAYCVIRGSAGDLYVVV